MTDAPRTPGSPEKAPMSRAASAVLGVVGAASLVLAMILANPGGGATAMSSASSSSAPASSVAPTGATTEVAVDVVGMSFSPNAIEVPAGNRLVLTVTNSAEQRHDLVLATGASTGSIAPGATASLDAGVITGDLEGWCSIPGHRQAGMTLTIHAMGAPRPSNPGASSSASSGSGSASSTNGTAGMEGMAGMGGTSDGAFGGGGDAPSMAALVDHAEKTPARDAALPALETGTEHRYTFTVTEQTEQVTDEVTRATWTFNGDSPGPILHGRIGDVFRITLVNKGSMSHSIDFHAGLVSPDRVMRSIEPGQTLEYVFQAKNAGIWLYHCSTMPMSMHIANGMFGAVVIDPSDLDPVDREYVLIGSEMYLGAQSGVADSGLLAEMRPNLAAFNGRAFQYRAHPLTAKVGERVRMWVLDAGPNLPLAFHVVGAQFDTVWREGDYLLRRGGSSGGASQVLALQAAEGGFVEFAPLEAGSYNFVDHAMSVAEMGRAGTLRVTE